LLSSACLLHSGQTPEKFNLTTGPVFGGKLRGPGDRTVQFSYGGRLKVYHAGSVNYALWGRMFFLCKHAFRDPAYSEWAAVAAAYAHKFVNTDGSYAREAAAFVRFGFSAKDPTTVALPNPSYPENTAAPSTFRWRWIGLRDQ